MCVILSKEDALYIIDDAYLNLLLLLSPFIFYKPLYMYF